MLLTVGSSVKGEGNDFYVLDEIIGKGSFGYVFKARRKKDDAVFAVKAMLPSFGDSYSAASFKNEMRLAEAVKGDNIIQYEFVHSGEAYPELPPYIVMEYADGGTLTQQLKHRQQIGKPLELVELLDIFRQLAHGMDEINRTLVHRDIKPDNILLCGNTLKISDFGLSRIAIEGTRMLTFKGWGTPLYMAPEAWDYGKNTIQMDIYSMGIIFYELATFRYPYLPVPKTDDDCKSAHLHSAIQNLNSVSSFLTPSLISVINRMLEKSTQRRFDNWKDIIRLIEEQKEPDSMIDKLVTATITAKNAEDIARQERESNIRQTVKEKDDFCKLVRSQFDNTIVASITSYIEKVNEKYAGNEKITFSKSNGVGYQAERFTWEMIIPPDNVISIKMEAILKENYKRKVRTNRFWGEEGVRTENYIPQFSGRNIHAWGEVKNKAGYGFNLLLIDSGEIYGDWHIMNNKNNLSYMNNKERREPFSFSLNELPEEIDRVQITHLYRAVFEPFSESSLLDIISKLIYELK